MYFRICMVSLGCIFDDPDLRQPFKTSGDFKLATSWSPRTPSKNMQRNPCKTSLVDFSKTQCHTVLSTSKGSFEFHVFQQLITLFNCLWIPSCLRHLPSPALLPDSCWGPQPTDLRLSRSQKRDERGSRQQYLFLDAGKKGSSLNSLEGKQQVQEKEKNGALAEMLVE